MTNGILEYIGFKDSTNDIKRLKTNKPKYNISKSFDNSDLYKIYKRISIHNLEVLVSDSDRTTDIKERYENSIPLDEYIKKEKDEFISLTEKCSIKDINEINDLQEKFEKNTPYFVKYEKNYLWQIYYSKEEDKYFMLFPTKEGETAVLFYIIKKKLEDADTYIYVPICKGEYSEGMLTTKEISEIENYIWLFTKKWPIVFEVCNDLYIIGETEIQENFKTKYRIRLENKTEAEKEYTLLKALFILDTETNYKYKYKPQIDEKGKLVLTYNNEIITIQNLQDFVQKQTKINKGLKEKLEELIKLEDIKLINLKKKIKNQNQIYANQEKQIVAFLNCKKSFLKRVKFFFSSTKKLKIYSKKIIEQDEERKNEEESNERKIEKILENSDQKLLNELQENNQKYTIADLVRACSDTRQIQLNEGNLRSDIKALELKITNLSMKIENAEKYIAEIEEHKKSIFEFWKFTNKDNLVSLEQGNEEEKSVKLKTKFDLREDFQSIALKADELQRRKLSTDEENAIYATKYILSSINSIISKSETYKIEEEYDKLKEKYSKKDAIKEILGGISDDYTTVKVLKNKKHRENSKNIYSTLKFNELTTFEEFRDKANSIALLLNESFQKISSVCEMPIYYAYKNRGYTLGEINPYKLINDENIDKIYKTIVKEDTHILYYSNIVFYDNFNKTLPMGMDESTSVLLKVGGNKRITETTINILIEKDLFTTSVKKIKVIEEEQN